MSKGKKKKNKKKKDQKIVSSNEKVPEDFHDKESHDLQSKQQVVDETGSSMRELPNLRSTEDDIFTPKAESEDGDIDDDEIDPARKELLDREVEDFARRLNTNWVSSQGQERRPVHFSINGNGTTRRQHIGQSPGQN